MANSNQTLFNDRFETKYSLFSISNTHDIAGSYTYRIVFENDSHKDSALRITTENGKSQTSN
jgi:hypothetical protein